MANWPVNSYPAPFSDAKLSAAEAADVERRDVAILVLLFVVTLGLYWFYLAYHWAKEINGLLGRAKYQPVVVLLVSIVTCGLAGLVFEVLFALDAAQATKSRGITSRNEQLATWVIVCNCVGLAVSLIPFGVIVGFPLMVLASVLVQVELNRLADHYARA